MLKEGLLSWRLRSGAGSTMFLYSSKMAQTGKLRMTKDIQPLTVLLHRRRMTTNDVGSSVLSICTHVHPTHTINNGGIEEFKFLTSIERCSISLVKEFPVNKTSKAIARLTFPGIRKDNFLLINVMSG
jgi:hypothetical protein